MTTAPLPRPRAFFILSTTSLTTSELTTVATTFLVVYGRSILPTPLPDVTLSFSFPEPFTSYIVDSRANALRVDVIGIHFLALEALPVSSLKKSLSCCLVFRSMSLQKAK